MMMATTADFDDDEFRIFGFRNQIEGIESMNEMGWNGMPWPCHHANHIFLIREGLQAFADYLSF